MEIILYSNKQILGGFLLMFIIGLLFVINLTLSTSNNNINLSYFISPLIFSVSIMSIFYINELKKSIETTKNRYILSDNFDIKTCPTGYNKNEVGSNIECEPCGSDCIEEIDGFMNSIPSANSIEGFDNLSCADTTSKIGSQSVNDYCISQDKRINSNGRCTTTVNLADRTQSVIDNCNNIILTRDKSALNSQTERDNWDYCAMYVAGADNIWYQDGKSCTASACCKTPNTCDNVRCGAGARKNIESKLCGDGSVGSDGVQECTQAYCCEAEELLPTAPGTAPGTAPSSGQSYKSKYTKEDLDKINKTIYDDLTDVNKINTKKNKEKIDVEKETKVKKGYIVNKETGEVTRKSINGLDNINDILSNPFNTGSNNTQIKIFDTIINFFKLLLGITEPPADTDTEPPADTDPPNNIGLFGHIEDLIESIFIFFKDIIIKIIKMFYQDINDTDN